MQADILVLSGLPAPNKFAALAYQLARLSTKRNGPYHRDKFLDRLMNGKFLAKLPHAKTAFDWLCSDEQIVKDYIADPLCGFVFTAAGFRDLFFWLRRLTAAKWVKKIPKNLPIIIFAGERDPVGVYGLGVRKVDYRLRRSGHEVDLLIYPHGHHEMLNEVNKRDVWSDVTSRLNKFFPLDVPN